MRQSQTTLSILLIIWWCQGLRGCIAEIDHGCQISVCLLGAFLYPQSTNHQPLPVRGHPIKFALVCLGIGSKAFYLVSSLWGVSLGGQLCGDKVGSCLGVVDRRGGINRGSMCVLN